MPIKILFLFLVFLSLGQAAQDSIVHLTDQQKEQLRLMERDLDEQANPASKSLTPQERKIRTITTINSFIRIGEEFLKENEKNIKSASTIEEKLALEDIEKKTIAKITELRNKLMETATGVSEEAYLNSGKSDDGNLSNEVRTVLAPLLGEFHSMTAWPRELSALQSEQAIIEARLQMSKQAVENVRALKESIDKSVFPNITPKQKQQVKEGQQKLSDLESIWSSRVTDAKSQMELIKMKIMEGEKNAPTIGQIITIIFHKLWQKLGVNLLLALLVFFGTAAALRFLYYLARKFSPFHKAKEINSRQHALAHLADLTAFYISLVISTAAVLATLYIRGDGLLITILLLILIWMGWSLKNEIPAYISRSRLMLNLGSLRVGERVIYQGLPWRVESINLFCEFRNPALEGGRIRVPLKEALSLVSRPIIPGETWFPTQKGDSYILPNGERALILRQTVEQICVDLATGGTRIYDTLAFYKLSPEVLTQGFDMVVYLEVDYNLQPVITTTVPRLLHENIMKAVKKLIPEESIVSSFVDFNQPLGSSLQLICYIKVKGNLYKHYSALKRLINKIFVDTCTEQGWNIPYPHLTIKTKEALPKNLSIPSLPADSQRES